MRTLQSGLKMACVPVFIVLVLSLLAPNPSYSSTLPDSDPLDPIDSNVSKPTDVATDRLGRALVATGALTEGHGAH